MAASTHRPPKISRIVSGSLPMATENIPAKTGSMIKTIAVSVGEMIDCAQVCTRKARAVASTAVMPTVHQTVLSGGSIMPPGDAATKQMTATVAICTNAKLYTL